MSEFRPSAGESLGRWKLMQRLGSGANAEVWKAEDGTGITAAVKILHKRDASSEPYKRFVNEVIVIVASDGAAVIGLAAEFGPSLFAGFGYRAYSDGEIQVAAGYIVGRNDWPQEEVFIRHEKFKAGSARQAQLVSEIHEAMTAHLRGG